MVIAKREPRDVLSLSPKLQASNNQKNSHQAAFLNQPNKKVKLSTIKQEVVEDSDEPKYRRSNYKSKGNLGKRVKREGSNESLELVKVAQTYRDLRKSEHAQVRAPKYMPGKEFLKKERIDLKDNSPSTSRPKSQVPVKIEIATAKTQRGVFKIE